MSVWHQTMMDNLVCFNYLQFYRKSGSWIYKRRLRIYLQFLSGSFSFSSFKWPFQFRNVVLVAHPLKSSQLISTYLGHNQANLPVDPHQWLEHGHVQWGSIIGNRSLWSKLSACYYEWFHSKDGNHRPRWTWEGKLMILCEEFIPHMSNKDQNGMERHQMP